MIKLFFILFTLVPFLSFAQKIRDADVQKVMLLFEQGQNDSAFSIIDSLKKTVRKKDENYKNLIVVGAEMSTKVFNYKAGIIYNEELIKLFPETEIDCQTHIAEFKKYLGDFDGAIAAYKRIFELNPSDEITFSNMADAYNSAGRYEEALHVLNCNPNTGTPTFENYNYAIAYFNLNKFDSAKIAIDKYLVTEYALNDFEGYKYAAQIYFALGDKKKSCELITKATDIIITTKSEEQINKQPQKIKEEYYFIKNYLKEIDETKKLKTRLCN